MARARIAVVGAAGAVGQELIDRLSSLPMAAEVVGFEQAEQDGDDDRIEVLTDPALLGAYDVVVFAIDATAARRLAPHVAPEAHLLDLSTAHVGEAGWHRLATGSAPGAPSRRMVLPTAAADLVVQVLAALGRARRVLRASVTVLEPASGLGRPGLDALRDQTVGLLSFRTPDPAPFERRAAFDLLAAGDPAALRAEVLALGILPAGALSVQRVRVPVFIGLAAGIQVTLGDAEAANLPVPTDVRPVDSVVPALDELAGLDHIHLGRPALDPDNPDAVTLWAACDNLARTAARAAAVVRAVVELIAAPALH